MSDELDLTIRIEEPVRAALQSLNGPPMRDLADFVAWLAYSAAAISPDVAVEALMLARQLEPAPHIQGNLWPKPIEALELLVSLLAP